MIASRLTGDNFAYLKYCDDAEEGNEIYQALTEEIRKRYPQAEVVISEGRYIIDDRQIKINTMYDRAAYAKKQIKGRYDVHTAVYSEKMHKTVLLKQDITGMMKRALLEKQLEVYYQPQYNQTSGEISGAEALVRWNHPTRGMMLPDEFIPIFEKNGFIYQMDEYVWNSVCEDMKGWMKSGLYPPHVSVNVSRYDILQKDFFERITRVVNSHGIQPSLFHLEVTESAFSNSPELIINTMRQLKLYGFVVEIDDFGSGYSSLNTLKDFPTDVIKLDMKFLSGGDEFGRGDDILVHIIRMAKSIGLNVIAEGVETAEQADQLVQHNCQIMQGFYYAKPMSVSQFRKLLKNGGTYGTRVEFERNRKYG